MNIKSIADRARKLHAAAHLSPVHLAALWAIVQSVEKNPAAPVRIDLANKFLVDAVERLEAEKIIVRGDKPNIVRLFKAAAATEEYAAIAAAVTKKFFPNGAPVAPTAKKPAMKASAPDAAGALDWAFRRLRRQATMFFANGDADLQKTLRAKLNHITTGYGELKRAFEGDDSELITICKKRGGWEDFMEWFFGHTIHPGSRLEAANATKDEE